MEVTPLESSHLFVETPQLAVLPQRVQHLGRRLHHLHGVPGGGGGGDTPSRVNERGQLHTKVSLPIICQIITTMAQSKMY